MVKSVEIACSSSDLKAQGYLLDSPPTNEQSGFDTSREANDILKPRDRSLLTPLWKGVEDGDTEKIKFLIRQGANLKETDCHGNTLLHLSLTLGHYQMAQYMMQYFHDCNPMNNEGITPLHIIAENGKQLKLARKFINNDAKVNVADKVGRTPLMLACKRGHFPMASLLLKHGSDPSRTDVNGWSAEDHASIMGYMHIANLIQQYAKKKTTPKEEESEESSTDEDESIQLQFRKGKRIHSDHRVIPIKMRRKHKTSTNKVDKSEMKSEGIRDAKGNLLPIPEVVTVMKATANKVTDIEQWVQQQQQIAEEKRKKCEELQQNIKELLKEKELLLTEKENLTNELRRLIDVLEACPSKKEKECLQNQLSFMKEGINGLQSEHDEITKEVENLSTALEEEHVILTATISNHEKKMEDLNGDVEVMSDSLMMIQRQFHELKEDLLLKLKVINEVDGNLQILLRATYNLVVENKNKTVKLLERVEHQKNVTNSAIKSHLNKAKEDNSKLGRSLDQLINQTNLDEKLLVKLQNQLENHPIRKKLVEAGVMDEFGNKIMSAHPSLSSISTKRSKKGRKQIAKSQDEMQFDPCGIMALPADKPAVCYSTVEAARFSWIDPTVEDTATHELSTDSESEEFSKDEQDIKNITTGDDSMSPELKKKLADIVNKHK